MNYEKSGFEHKEGKLIGTCKQCLLKNNTIYDNELFVEAEEEMYHFSCYNEKENEEK